MSSLLDRINGISKPEIIADGLMKGGGWAPIPGGKHQGQRRKGKNGKWEYRYDAAKKKEHGGEIMGRTPRVGGSAGNKPIHRSRSSDEFADHHKDMNRRDHLEAAKFHSSYAKLHKDTLRDEGWESGYRGGSFASDHDGAPLPTTPKGLQAGIKYHQGMANAHTAASQNRQSDRDYAFSHADEASRHLPEATKHWGPKKSLTPGDLMKADLTTEGRKLIKDKNFALSGRRYPIQDISHARNALARVAQHGTPEEIKAVRRAVHKKYPSLAGPEDVEKAIFYGPHGGEYEDAAHKIPHKKGKKGKGLGSKKGKSTAESRLMRKMPEPDPIQVSDAVIDAGQEGILAEISVSREQGESLRSIAQGMARMASSSSGKKRTAYLRVGRALLTPNLLGMLQDALESHNDMDDGALDHLFKGGEGSRGGNAVSLLDTINGISKSETLARRLQ